MVAFVYLLLSGLRLGPPVRPRPPTETRRTMYEHVQMLASLYRRAGQLSAARDAFSRHYARLRTRSDSSLALRRIETARTESDLIAAVAAFDDAS